MSEGHWQICEPQVEHRGVSTWFWKTPDYPYSFCSMCLYRVKERNGTLIKPPTPPIINSRTESKPEKDSL